MPVSWQLQKGRGGRKKIVKTEGYFCPNKTCAYYGITEEESHALVGYGKHVLSKSCHSYKRSTIP